MPRGWALIAVYFVALLLIILGAAAAIASALALCLPPRRRCHSTRHSSPCSQSA
jgi:hypothetical protein